MFRAAHALILFAVSISVSAQEPNWIWHDNHAVSPAKEEIRFFRKQFNIPWQASRAELIATCDDEMTICLNGKQVASSANWKEPVRLDVTKEMRAGENLLAVRGKNISDSAGLFLKLDARSPNGGPHFVVSDKTWLSSAVETKGWNDFNFAAKDWTPVKILGVMCSHPWEKVIVPSATPAAELQVLPGFKAELIYNAQAGEGSWIAMAVDDKGRFIVSPEKNQGPLLRLTVARGTVSKVEKISAPVHSAMGLCYAHKSLYLNGCGPKGVGLYRLVDKNKNDQFDADEVELLKNFDGANEHGYHAVEAGPDGMIYVLNGNHTKVPDGLSPQSPLQNYADDLLLPRLWDPSGHARGILAPGGYVLRTDPQGKTWELFCGGFRNTYDFDFNKDGELFTFDSDMEYDIGAPWYRPTRINHCVSGGDYGWRSGSGKWPVYYPDSLPTTLDIGPGSPTAVKFGTHSKFPKKYREALFACDWNYGKIFAVHLQPEGASYGGNFETFVSGKPLATVAMNFGRDGAMYFITGGWKIQSGLYRISYVGPKQEPTLTSAEKKNQNFCAEQRAIRRKLESFHGKKNPAAIDLAWPYLDSIDPWLRYAARVAIESQEISRWKNRALAETRPEASIIAMLALARKADASLQPQLVEKLSARMQQRLGESQKLEIARVWQVCFIRLGKPSGQLRETAIHTLAEFYPADSEFVNRELCQLLVYLDAPDVVATTMKLLAAAPTQQEQMHYAFVLRNATNGWTMDLRKNYFSWFNKALAQYRGGNTFLPYLHNIRQDAIDKLADTERTELASIFDAKAAPTTPAAPPRAFVHDWKFAELVTSLGEIGKHRSFARGKAAFIGAQCVACHHTGGQGGSVGPDLTGVSGRFNRRDLLENIIFPSKIISDRYQNITITKRDGDDVSGSIADENDKKIVLMTNPLSPQRVEILKSEIASREISKLSAMPEGLLNVLSKEEILDLLAYLESDGKADARVFAAAK